MFFRIEARTEVCQENPAFAEAVGGSDVEAILLLPQLFGAFCAYHGHPGRGGPSHACIFDGAGLWRVGVDATGVRAF